MSQTQQTDGQARPLKVLIIGAGISGLTAAIVLRQNGHILYEQSRFAREYGAAMHVAPNAHGLFVKLGIDIASGGASEVEWIHEVAPDGKIYRELPVGKFNAIWQHKWMMAHRVSIHDALKEKALSPDGIGQPCELHLSCNVSDVDPEGATITLLDGTKITGDVLIGADGVHSRTRQKISGAETIKPFPSGKSGFRFMIRREEALIDSNTKHLVEKTGVFSVTVGSDRRIVMYPTSHNTLLNFLAIHPDSESEASSDWGTTAGKSALLEVYKEWAPAFQAILNKADPESLKVWRLLDMENLPLWYVSRLVLIGDAAHPFLPHQGQGGAVAMEDAVALGSVLERGLQPEEIPERLKLYNDIRYERACKIQEFTRLAGLDGQDGKLDTVEFSKYNFAHDEFDNSAQKLREWKWARLPNIIFRMPVAFGPDQSIGQSGGNGHMSPIYCTTSMCFQTSRTLVKNLLPPGVNKFSFTTPGTVAICSFVHTSYMDVEQDQASHRNTFGFYIHDVVHTGSKGQQNRGAFICVLFEDQSHAIVRDREVYGLPAVYSKITAEHSADSLHMSASSNGYEWIKVTVENLKATANSASSTAAVALFPHGTGGSQLLSWRSVPSFSSEEDGDASETTDAFAVKLLFDDETEPGLLTQQTYESPKASIIFPVVDLTSGDVLGPIVSRLADVPIYKILGAKVVSGKGHPAFGHAHRI